MAENIIYLFWSSFFVTEMTDKFLFAVKDFYSFGTTILKWLFTITMGNISKTNQAVYLVSNGVLYPLYEWGRTWLYVVYANSSIAS